MENNSGLAEILISPTADIDIIITNIVWDIDSYFDILLG